MPTKDSLSAFILKPLVGTAHPTRDGPVVTDVDAIETAVANGQLTAGAATNLRHWLFNPVYAEFHAALHTTISAHDWDTLQAAFWQVLPFGTGGRRGPMGDFGTATVNRRTIAESAAGLAAYLRETSPAGPWSVVIAYDSRHRSHEFARIFASVLLAAGCEVHLFDGPRSTPALSFAVRHFNCSAGVMISASHNPPADNGVKVYWSHGGQVLPPHDAGIIAAVGAVGDIPQVPLPTTSTTLFHPVGTAFDERYTAAVAALSLSSQRDLRVYYSPLHGVGETSVAAVLSRAGFSGLMVDPVQRVMDGAFPGVPDHLPNPERPAVFKPLVEAAKTQAADMILASDPDADRLGAMVRDRAGQYVYLTGNQLGALLVDYVIQRRQALGTLSPADTVITTLVTTPLVGAIARAAGVTVIDDLLVGFKHIAATIERIGVDRLLFACEESHGYLAGDVARDKDAAIAALWLCEAAAEAKARGCTLLDRLEALQEQFGRHTEHQWSWTCTGADGQAEIARLMERLRTTPPGELAGFHLKRRRDYGRGVIQALPETSIVQTDLQPRGDLVIFEAHQGQQSLQWAVRPSGTEPKVKFYTFLQAPAAQQTATAAAQTLAAFEAAFAAWATA